MIAYRFKTMKNVVFVGAKKQNIDAQAVKKEAAVWLVVNSINQLINALEIGIQLKWFL